MADIDLDVSILIRLERAHDLLLDRAVLILVVSPIVCFAAEENSGTCGQNLTWRYDESTKTLIIEGTGSMTNWFSNRQVPWKHLRLEATSLSLPEGLTSVGDYAFYGFENISELYIPSTVTRVGHGAFSIWKSLKEVNITNGVKELGGWVFASCTKLEKITFPSSLTFIDYECFMNCPYLMDVTIPSTVTSLGRKSFGTLAGHAINYDMILRGVPGSNVQSFASTYFLNFVSVYSKSEAAAGVYEAFKGLDSEEFTLSEMDFNGDGIISTKDSLTAKLAS